MEQDAMLLPTAGACRPRGNHIRGTGFDLGAKVMQQRSFVALHLAGSALLVFGLGWFHAANVATFSYEFVGSRQFAWSCAFVGLVAVVGYSLGLPESARTRFELIGLAIGTIATSVVVLSLAQLGMQSQLLPRSVLGLVVTLFPLWTLIVWNLSGDHGQRLAARARVLVVAVDHEDLAALEGELARMPERVATIVGHVTPGQARGVSVGETPLVERAHELAANVIVLDSAAQLDTRIVDQMSELHGQGVRFRTMSLFYEEWLGKLPITELQRVALLFDIGEVHRVRYTRAKRVLDVAIASIGLLVLLPVTCVVLVGNVMGNRGPLLFRQRRVGKNGVEFEILKFRTMAPIAGDDQRSWTEIGDSRIPPFGAVLRRTHLDELPQLWNILRGDLSVVGPRPEQVHYVEELSQKLPFYDIRHLCRPGLTGWAQVKFGYASDEGDALEKLQYDLFYLRRQGLSLDGRIIVRTLRHVVGRGGR